jgi:hypothetical protein
VKRACNWAREAALPEAAVENIYLEFRETSSVMNLVGVQNYSFQNIDILLTLTGVRN